jgi:hypothetical protein
MMIDFLSQYMNHKSVRTAYARDPHKTLRKYGVTKAQLTLLASDGLETVVTAEVRRILSGDRDIHPFGWAVPAMEVTGFDPPSAERNKPFTLTVYGKHFKSYAKVAVSGGAQGKIFDATSTTWDAENPNQLVGSMPVLHDVDDYTVGAYYTLTDGAMAGGKATAFLNVYDPGHAPTRKRSRNKPPATRKPAGKSAGGQRRSKRPATNRAAAKKQP